MKNGKATQENGKLLSIEGLKTYFYTPGGVVRAVDDVSFFIRKGETLGLVGESGCGKSVCAMSIVRLIPDPPGKIVSGDIVFEGLHLDKLPVEKLWDIRGRDIGMIFQEPMSSLNPVYTIGHQLTEPVLLHETKDKRVARERALRILGRVGIPDPDRCLKRYPHELSGGMQQRVMIAMALICRPKLLIADEPSTALDVTIQAQILDLLRELQKDFDMAVLIITHDLGVVAGLAQRVAVMYASHIVEMASTREIFKDTFHPYTEGLIKSIPILQKCGDKLYSIPGTVPTPLEYPEGCNFSPRCPLVKEKCRREEPRLREVSPGHFAACWVRGKELK